MHIVTAAALAATLALVASPAHAQSSGAAGTPPAAAVRPALQTARDVALVRRLVVQTLVALHQANETGEYATFRALAAPAFQARNDLATLARTFGPLRAAGVDLGAAVVSVPTLDPAPFLDADNRLRVQGTLAIPQPNGTAVAAYAMAFAPVDGVWRLQEIAVRDAIAGR